MKFYASIMQYLAPAILIVNVVIFIYGAAMLGRLARAAEAIARLLKKQ